MQVQQQQMLQELLALLQLVQLTQSTVGVYTITYTSTDASGNAGTATRTVNVTDTVVPVFTSGATFIIDENQTAVGTVTATDLDTVTFTIDSDVLQITAAGVLSLITRTVPDFESAPVISI